jgi:hypothetical protein
MSKFKFIQNLLENEKFDLSQKERFFKLVSKELEKSSELDIKVLADIKKIKEKIGLSGLDIPTTNDGMTLTQLKSIANTKTKIKEDGSILLEDLIKVDGEIETKPVSDYLTKYNWIPSYINPAGLYKYLFDFNNNLILKSTCHKIDSDELKIINQECGTEIYVFKKHLSKIIETFEIHDKKYAPSFIKSFIRLYLTGKDFYGKRIGSNVKGKLLGWTEDTIVFSWSDEKLKKWSENNLELPPCPSDGLARKNKNLGFEFESPVINSFERNIATFSKLILHFKKMFHIKSDNSLKNLIIQQNRIKVFKDKVWNEEIDFIINDEEFPLNIEVFTYVERVIQAYNKILELVLENAKEKPKVKLTLNDDEDYVYFKIHHLNSQYSKTRTGILERLHGQTYKNMILNQINGLCDLFVETDLGNNEFVRFNLWDKNYNKKTLKNNLNPIKITTSEKPVNGVAHILQFKKK